MTWTRASCSLPERAAGCAASAWVVAVLVNMTRFKGPGVCRDDGYGSPWSFWEVGTASQRTCSAVRRQRITSVKATHICKSRSNSLVLGSTLRRKPGSTGCARAQSVPGDALSLQVPTCGDRCAYGRARVMVQDAGAVAASAHGRKERHRGPGTRLRQACRCRAYDSSGGTDRE